MIGVGADTYSHGWIGRRNPGERSSAALASCRSGQSGGVVPRCAARLCLGIELSRVEGQGAEVLGIISGVVVALVILLIAVPTLVLSLRAPETRTRVCFALVGHSLLVAASFWACSAVIKETLATRFCSACSSWSAPRRRATTHVSVDIAHAAKRARSLVSNGGCKPPRLSD